MRITGLLMIAMLLVALPATASLQFGANVLLPAHGEEVYVPGHSVPCLADLNTDGYPDLLVGEGSGLYPGRVRLYLNEALGAPPSFGDYDYLRLLSGAEISYPGG
ncbi:hypothetical protein FJ251_14090 [bacterium]|nr:hypothetical protein [bacterium]